eukprot:m.117275 g.117275  ORF g.117275 m.117275 type:complete len:144 (+) comp12872_c0_seq1:3-434(+)
MCFTTWRLCVYFFCCCCFNQPIEKGEPVIEYLGERIRETVADDRERFYMRTGVGSSYLFRVDDDNLIDATHVGSIARFVNHSCDPTCTAEVVPVEGRKRIVIYAERYIEKGAEVTYDYKFSAEEGENKIPCMCGAPNCKGFLN